MPNASSDKNSLNAGETATIKAGTYVANDITVTANTLASQTNATATADKILKNKTAWVDGKKLTGTMTDYQNTTVDYKNIAVSNDNYSYTSVPSGYYDSNSTTIKVPNEVLTQNLGGNAEYVIIGCYQAFGHSAQTPIFYGKNNNLTYVCVTENPTNYSFDLLSIYSSNVHSHSISVKKKCVAINTRTHTATIYNSGDSFTIFGQETVIIAL